MAARKAEVHHGVPHSLLTLYEKAHGTSLDGEGIQAWVEWELEAMRWKVPIEISRDELETLVDPSEVLPEEGHQMLPEGDRSGSETAVEAKIVLKPLETISNGEERA